MKKETPLVTQDHIDALLAICGHEPIRQSCPGLVQSVRIQAINAEPGDNLNDFLRRLAYHSYVVGRQDLKAAVSDFLLSK